MARADTAGSISAADQRNRTAVRMHDVLVASGSTDSGALANSAATAGSHSNERKQLTPLAQSALLEY
jgi:hypothetical protein